MIRRLDIQIFKVNTVYYMFYTAVEPVANMPQAPLHYNKGLQSSAAISAALQ